MYHKDALILFSNKNQSYSIVQLSLLQILLGFSLFSFTSTLPYTGLAESGWWGLWRSADSWLRLHWPNDLPNSGHRLRSGTADPGAHSGCLLFFLSAAFNRRCSESWSIFSSPFTASSAKTNSLLLVIFISI